MVAHVLQHVCIVAPYVTRFSRVITGQDSEANAVDDSDSVGAEVDYSNPLSRVKCDNVPPGVQLYEFVVVVNLGGVSLFVHIFDGVEAWCAIPVLRDCADLPGRDLVVNGLRDRARAAARRVGIIATRNSDKGRGDKRGKRGISHADGLLGGRFTNPFNWTRDGGSGRRNSPAWVPKNDSRGRWVRCC